MYIRYATHDKTNYTIAPGQTLIFVCKKFGKPQGKFGSLEPFWPEPPTEDIDFQNPQRVVSYSSIQDLWPCQVWCMKIICWCVWFGHFGTRSWNNLILCIVVVSYKSCKRTTNCYTRWVFFMEQVNSSTWYTDQSYSQNLHVMFWKRESVFILFNQQWKRRLSVCLLLMLQ